MARNVTITTTVTKTAGQILYEAAEAPADGLGALPPWHEIPAEEQARFERMAEALIKALDAERAAAVPHVRLTPLTHDPQQPLPAWPGVIVQAPAPGHCEFRGELQAGPEGVSVKAHADGSISFSTTGDISGLDGHWNNPGGKR